MSALVLLGTVTQPLTASATTWQPDADTADVFTEISRATDKQLWFVEAHLNFE